MTAAGEPRALLVTTDLPPTRGGIQSMVEAVCARSPLIAAVIGPGDPTEPDLGVPTARVGHLAGPSLVRALARAARASIRHDRPDVVLAMHPLASPAGLFHRVPTVVVTHGGELRSARIRAVARVAFRRARAVVANSVFTRRAAIAAGADPARVVVIPVGAPPRVNVPDADRDARRRALGEGRVVLCVARLEPHKGQDALITALGALPEDVRVVLVGEGSTRAALQAQAEHAGVAERVSFAGSVPDEELPSYLAAADAFALLSRATAGGVEGGGIALLEAATYGVPIVAGASGGIPETIAHGRTGLLVDPDEPAAVARALHRVLDDRAFASLLGEHARAVATTERTWDRFAARLDQVLRAAAGGVR